jgi:hypothetical protein
MPTETFFSREHAPHCVNNEGLIHPKDMTAEFQVVVNMIHNDFCILCTE